MKTCNKCKQEKELTEFYKDKSRKDGLQVWCKECSRKYKQANKEAIAEYNRNNKEAKAEYDREYYQANKEAITERNRKYNQNNAEAKAEYDREYQQNNKEAIAKRIRNHRQNNKEARAEYNREYRRARLQTDINYRLRKNLRERLYKALKGISKSASTMELVGCTIKELKSYLEAQFTRGMSWENYGEWEIDHIKPFALFDLTDTEQQRECCNRQNLQPLWAKDNQSKGDRWGGVDHRGNSASEAWQASKENTGRFQG